MIHDILATHTTFKSQPQSVVNSIKFRGRVIGIHIHCTVIPHSIAEWCLYWPPVVHACTIHYIQSR